ncbi:Nn.00g055600.m01.CDS01 [Neocucurbitaria sp. VM-36]
MENTRASGSSRAVNPTLLKVPDAYPQKRTSYRRPVDAQPAAAPQAAPAAAPTMSNTIPSNTARPVAAAPASNGIPRASSHRRRQSQQIPPPTTGAMSESVPAAPDVPRAPPMSYKDPYAQKASSRGPPRATSGRSRDPAIQLNPSRQQATIQTAADRLYDLRSPPYEPVEPLAGTVERRNSQRRPSVPDRSPLQKLEGKLDDISKEERRARILEAELAAQEKAEAEMRARRARVAAEQQQQQRVVSQPITRGEKPTSGPNRTTSTNRHVSMPASHKSPQISDLESDDGIVYDISEPWDPSPGQGAGAPAVHRAPSQKQPRVSSGYQQVPYTDAAIPRSTSLKGKEPVGTSRGAGSFRDRSAAPTSQNVHRKPVAGPTGLGLVGVDDTTAGAEVTRSDSRRVGQGRRDSRGIMAAQMEMQQQAIDQKGSTRDIDNRHLHPHDPPVAPTNRKSVGFSEPDAEVPPGVSQESHRHHHFGHHDQAERTYIAPPMLEEWKGAPVGTLTADDLDLDAPVRANSGNKAWWEESQSSRPRRSSGYAEPTYDGYADEAPIPTTFTPQLYLKCGPLLRYTGLRRDRSRGGKEREIWRGSVMIVTIDAQSSYSMPPTLRLFKQPMDILPPPPLEVNGDQLDPSYVDPIEGQIKVSRTGKTLYVKPVDELAENEDLSRIEDDTGLFATSRSSSNGSGTKATRIRKKDGEKLGKLRDIPGVRLYTERGVTFWRFNLEVELGSSQARIAYKINKGPAIGFWVPAKGESMNIMFHSCNGFSFSVESKEFCGPDPMWRDVLNTHQTRPFHVMLGGGDQIYNDAAMRQTTLFRQWTESRNPLQKHNAPFSEEMQNELEQFYLDRYSMWFSQGLFGMANSQIPMVNIWDDHDIIDGYGSYPHHFMQTPVFTGIGAVAFKYYMLFQHQSVVAETEKTEPSWVLGKNPGPYIKERSRSVFMHLGRQVAFLGLDCRTERQRDEILTEDSYDIIFDRLEDEIIKGETKHLIVLLGVPIAYPRLNFLENILTSRLMDPIKYLGRAGVLGNFVNKFDGGVEILDDLDDHWTAKHHKEERNWFIRELQHIASTKSVRITILGGDVHLAAVGQFYTNKKLNIPKDKDHRYMPNVVSSAIVNTPPPDMMADIINKRNKVHHLDPYTDEDMIPIFTHDVDGKKRNNNHLLPHRNWCSIREYKPGTTPPGTPSPPTTPQDGQRLTRTLSDYAPGQMVRRLSGNQTRPSARSRGPPLSYYNNPAYAAADEEQTGPHNEPQSSFSPDRSEPERPRSRRNSLTSLFRRRTSVDSARQVSSQSLPPPRDRDSVSQDRPSNFHRRPSVISKKVVKQHGEYINLEGGLDICLNLEVSQHDPAGITTPYRLLVPALHYTAPEPGALEKQRRKSKGVFGVFGGAKHKSKIGDDGYSMSGSESGSELGEISDEDEEERARQKYKVGPRILIPGFGSRNKRNSASAQAAAPEKRLSSGYHTNSYEAPRVDPEQTDDSRDLAPVQTQERDRRQSIDVAPNGQKTSAWESVAGRRHVSAPQYPSTTTTTQTTTQTTVLPSRSASTRKQPTYNSSHKSQLPAPPSESEQNVQRRSMGGILNQHSHDKKWEHEAHVITHTPSQKRSKRESYPPHPAIVGAGPGSPYSRDGPVGMQARNDTTGGDYFASGGRDAQTYPSSAPTSRAAPPPQPPPTAAVKPTPIEREYAVKPVQRAEYAQRGGYDRTSSYPSYPQRNGNAGVGARYLGGGRYEDEDEYDSLDDDDDDDDDDESERARGRGDDGRSYSGREGEASQESFVVPKKKKKWQIWR